MEQTIKADPRNTLPYKFLASYYEYFKDPGKAISYRRELASLDPWNADNLLQWEMDCLVLGDKASAAKLRAGISRMAPGTSDAQRATALIK